MALSTTEAKYMAISKATRKAMWLWNLLNELGFTQNEYTMIHIDNQIPIKNLIHHNKTKHIDIQHQYKKYMVVVNEMHF
jgi:phage anti-repressor protein